MSNRDSAARQQEHAAESPGARQLQASNPLSSHWVGASAGTGKTKVLIDRVLRLMLPRPGMDRDSATKPERVLCLTFTKTAAAEMSGRIYEALGKWSVMDDAALAAELERLTGAPPSPEMAEEARRLFARVLDTPGGLKIMTIHSFCQSVLKRFPVEAGLPPHFELMDEHSAVECLTRCLHDIITDARRDPDSGAAQAFNALALLLDSDSMSDLMRQIMAQRSLLSEILRHHGDAGGDAGNTVAALRRRLGLEDGETESAVLEAAGRIVPEHEAGLRQALSALLSGGKTDNDRAAPIQAWLEAPAARGALYSRYRRAFFTGDGKIYSRLATNAAVKAFPDIIEVMQYEAERLQDIDRKLQCLRLADVNTALLRIAAQIVGRYARVKRETARLDYEDLIIHTCDLLSEKRMVQWVLYKLDEGIDHILVDEAQDTSPRQWRIVRALCDEFFDGEGSRGDTVRTLFVVGDEKQSIFSFQGADPGAFAKMQAFFGDRVRQVQAGWDIVLDYSFRSTRTVLELVDGVFSVDTVRRGVAAREVRHLPFRAGHAGLVELWPLQCPAAAEAPPAWPMPVHIDKGHSAPDALARKIAGTVRHWLDTGERLASRNRPIRAGDVLVLVQSRGAFVESLLRALKEADVPVAGTDRMTLTEEIAVMDLIAAAQFALQPHDDLTLATLLKSPLIGLAEEELYALCHGRAGHLWPVLKDARPDIAAFLGLYIYRAGRATPYEFFAEILSTPCFADKTSGRRAFYGRLGFDVQDALDEFLNAALQYEQAHTPAVQTFIDWFMRGEANIKREQEQHQLDQVRIMTVHGSKGLQAPIVFMPDTVKKGHDHNKGRVRLVWPEDETGVPLWSPRAEFDAPPYAAVRDAAREGQEEEYRRLLYVGMTRAEDRLYVCGYRGKHAPKDDCWYQIVRNAFPAGAEKIPDGVDETGAPQFILRHAHAQDVAAREDKPARAVAAGAAAPLPPWVFMPPVQESLPPVPLAPSRPGTDEPAVKSPLGADDGWKYRRGVIVHQILEVLPQLPAAAWEGTLSAFLARPALQIPPNDRAAFAAEILAVLRHPEFAPIFGPASRAEVPVVGLAGRAHVLSGQMDRILVTAGEVLIVDYKTNRPPPRAESAVPPVYLKQMAAYRAVMRDIYPNHEIKCALLWTDGPYLMPLSAKSLDPHAP